MPALMEALHGLIPACDSMFGWCNADGEATHFYEQNPGGVEQVSLYWREFYKGRERGLYRPFPQAVHHDPTVTRLERELLVSKRKFLASDFYNLIMRPLDQYDGLRLIPREGGRPLGALMLWRSAQDVPFRARDERRFAALAPYLAHALTAADEPDAPLVDGQTCGLLIADQRGRLVHWSAQGRALLFYATHPQVTPGRMQRQPAALPPAVARLCGRLADVFQDSNPAAPPVLLHRNAWGEFSFRAYWLDRAEADGSGESASDLIGITVQRREPLPLKLLRCLEPLALSRRQTQLCLLMAGGLSVAAIAARMHVAESTVIRHRHQLYLKLDVQNRGELMSKLMTL